VVEDEYLKKNYERKEEDERRKEKVLREFFFEFLTYAGSFFLNLI